MPGKKKRFIDKKNAVTFHLVHRSQKDPLQANEEASKHVLVESKKDDVEKRQEEQRKFGVFFDDGYDYLQHLKDLEEIHDVWPVAPADNKEEDPGEEPVLKLPSSVFASEVEKDVGLLNEAVPIRGPQPNWDPDIVEGLDEDFDFEDPENQLDDDFVLKANQPGAGKEGEEYGRDGGDSDDEFGSDVPSDEADMSDDDFDEDDREQMFMDEETKSRFTSYSMTSSVIRRNEGLTLLDDRFEKFFEAYDDSEIGALDQEEIDGTLQHNSELLNSMISEFETKQAEKRDWHEVTDEQKEKQEQEMSGEEEEESNDEDLVKMFVTEPKEKWDCESILSTYSNLYNHPKLIEEPKKEKVIELKGPHGIPADVLNMRGLTQKQVEQDMRTRERSDRACTYRPKGETAEERAERKKAIKLERQERRQEKKMNKMAFAAEKKKQDKEILNVQSNLKHVKIV